MADILTNEKQAVPSRPAPADLSKEMEQSMARQSDERIEVVRVYDDFYRCNWWVEDKTPHSFWLASGRIKKSTFVRATKTGDGLLIEQLKAKAKGSGGSGVFDRPRQTKGTFGHS